MTPTPNASTFINKILPVALALLLVGGPGRAQDAGQAPALESLLAEARRLYDQVDQAGAVAVLDRAIPMMTPRRSERSVQPLLVAAFQLRARALFGTGDRARSQADMEALLRVDPAYRMPGDVSPRVVALFEETRKAIVGEVSLVVKPDDAEVDVDGVPVPSGERTLSLTAGPHTVSARRAGYRPVSQQVTVAAGSTQPLSLALERSSASLAFVTVPAGVEVTLDGSARGITGEGGRSAAEQELAARYQLPVDQVSRKMTLSDLALGTHVLEFRKSCFVSAERRVNVDRLDDLAIEPVTLAPATGTLRVSAAAADATVFIDDSPRGSAPATVSECEGPHTVELRSPTGRFIRRVTVRAGDQQSIEGQLKPAFALLSVSGLPEGLRGGEDLRVAVERALGSSTRITLFAPPAERVQKALQAESLTGGWLAFDRVGRPIGAAAENIAPAERRDLSVRLSRALDAQGVAAVTVSGTDRTHVLVTLLASGSAAPDVIAVRLDSPESAAQAIGALDVTAPLFAPSVGLLAIDVLGVQGAVIARVDRAGGAAAAALAAGEVITVANGRPIASAEALNETIRGLAAGTTLSLDVKPRGAAAVKRVELRPTLTPRAVAMADQTLLFNPLLLQLRRGLAAQAPSDEDVLRLNIGIALMRLGNWQDARGELERVKLPAGGGVSDGTVQYLLGLCFEALGLFADAEKAWTIARSSEALLTPDGPPVKDLAAAKIAAIARTRGGLDP